jgi:thymidine kinase
MERQRIMPHNNPQFIVFTGPMFSSKTTQLLTALERYEYQKKRVLALKPMMDDRYAVGEIMSHNGWGQAAGLVETGQDVLNKIAASEEIVDVVAIDEAFMIPGIADALVWLFKQGVTVIVSTLDISATGQVFDEVRTMLPWATNIIKCTAVCTVCGQDAPYTHRRTAGDEITVGGPELYEPRCFQHHVAVNDRDK